MGCLENNFKFLSLGFLVGEVATLHNACVYLMFCFIFPYFFFLKKVLKTHRLICLLVSKLP